ncbi:NUDIX hydrolase [Tenuibacillus multivorans]|uniref:8-oxo-dGTP diphosphatase n=1 Tax=Tenuibacillus multivorans TaxID=237069 RepID=A0A1H0DUR9_9BACI|nr:NUDIX hydrolase [Tenuibacillus multivorans]GEL76776.1 hypothetical protein TMU01_10110 [Tenuibacillus multivorans]SDN73741.1 8-oxo-dGTP diphosphatase [Tenuibacillus multivorans]
MKLRQFAAAFLINEDQEILFLQKPEDAKFLAGHLVPIGGHMEASEINTPEEACLREINEETGLSSHQISKLTLQYLTHRLKDNEIRIQYIYFGYISKDSNLTNSDEGSLVWINPNNINDLKVTASAREIIKHHKLNVLNENIYVGTMKSLNGEPGMTWSILEDWDKK